MTRLRSEAYLESAAFPFFAQRYTIGSGEVIAPHSHEFVELVYVCAGCGRHEYLGQAARLTEGDVFVISPGDEHAYVCQPSESLTVYNVLFDPAFFLAELTALSQVTSFVNLFYVEPFLRAYTSSTPAFTLRQTERIEVEHWIESLVREITGKDLGYRLLIKTRLIKLFVFLSRCYDRRQRYPLASPSDDEVKAHACALIDRHFAQSPTRSQLCRSCGMSQSAFTAKFKRHTGKTYVEYRNQIRIRVAQELLRETSDKIVSIASDVGFSDLSFFNRTFRELVGMSPSQYRIRERGVAPSRVVKSSN